MGEQETLALLDKCMKVYNSDVTTKGLVLTSLVKLSSKFSPSAKFTIAELITPFQASMSLELQQRSAEYTALLSTAQWDGLRKELLGKMPVLDETALRRRKAAFDDTIGDFGSNERGSSSGHTVASSSSSSLAIGKKLSELMDRDECFDGDVMTNFFACFYTLFSSSFVLSTHLFTCLFTCSHT